MLQNFVNAFVLSEEKSVPVTKSPDILNPVAKVVCNPCPLVLAFLFYGFGIMSDGFADLRHAFFETQTYNVGAGC